MTAITPRVIDISLHNVGPLKRGAIDFEAVASAGICGVICKASEGAAYGDPTYAPRRKEIKAAGVLHGAYRR
jgi:lysozyme